MARLADGTNDQRLYAGHVAWVRGQLDAEIRAGGWKLVPATPDLVFSTEPGELWSELDARAPGTDVVADTHAAAEAASLQARRAPGGFGISARSAFK